MYMYMYIRTYIISDHLANRDTLSLEPSSSFDKPRFANDVLR